MGYDDPMPHPDDPDLRPAAPGVRTGLTRSRRGRLLGGVCAGLERRTGVNAWWYRLGFVLGNFLPGPGLIVYLGLWAALRLED